VTLWPFLAKQKKSLPQEAIGFQLSSFNTAYRFLTQAYPAPILESQLLLAPKARMPNEPANSIHRQKSKIGAGLS
jgi:hypothetical protein